MSRPVFSALLLIGMVVMITSVSFSQDGYEDVVYLKNGGIMRGMIIEQIPGKSLKIQTVDRNVFVYSFDEIEKITKEKKPGASEVGMYKSSGYLNITRVGVLAGGQSTMFSASITNGVQVGEYFSLGLGVGFDNYPNETVLPLFLDFRGYLLEGQIAPMIFADLGYSLGKVTARDEWDAGGLMFSIGAGVQLKTSASTSVMFEIGYKYQELNGVFSWYTFPYLPFGPVIDGKLKNELLSVMVGFSF